GTEWTSPCRRATGRSSPPPPSPISPTARSPARWTARTWMRYAATSCGRRRWRSRRASTFSRSTSRTATSWRASSRHSRTGAPMRWAMRSLGRRRMRRSTPTRRGSPVGRPMAVTYASYLKLDELLALQQPRSAGPEHDEMLFIVIHQVYELWFKEMLHELAYLEQLLRDNDTPRALHTLKRILTVLKVMVAQIDVLETMTPLEFLSFRDRLESGSGF